MCRQKVVVLTNGAEMPDIHLVCHRLTSEPGKTNHYEETTGAEVHIPSVLAIFLNPGSCVVIVLVPLPSSAALEYVRHRSCHGGFGSCCDELLRDAKTMTFKQYTIQYA